MLYRREQTRMHNLRKIGPQNIVRKKMLKAEHTVISSIRLWDIKDLLGEVSLKPKNLITLHISISAQQSLLHTHIFYKYFVKCNSRRWSNMPKYLYRMIQLFCLE